MSVGRNAIWLAVLCLAPLLLPEVGQNGLEYRREGVLAGEIWRLWSGHFVHFSMQHALLDGFAGMFLAIALLHWWSGRMLLLRLLVLAPLISLVLMWGVPDMAIYRGASGLDMALLGILLRQMAMTRPAWRSGLIGIALLLGGKLLLDALGGFWSSLPPGVEVAWQAHGAGLLLGWLAGRPAPASPFSGPVAA